MRKNISAEVESFNLAASRMERLALLHRDHAARDNLYANETGDSPWSMKRFLTLVFKRKRQVMFISIFVVSAIVMSTLLTPSLYQGNAQILVKISRQNPYSQSQGGLKPVEEKQINSEIEILKSRSLAQKTLTLIGPSRVYPKNKTQWSQWMEGVNRKLYGAFQSVIDAMDKWFFKPTGGDPLDSGKNVPKTDTEVMVVLPKFRKALTVINVKNTNLINLSYKHQDPDMAAIVINTLADVYFDHHLEVHNSSNSLSFFKEQTSVLNDRIEKSQDKLKILKTEYNIISLEKERNFALEEAANLRVDMDNTRIFQSETERRIEKLKQQLKSTPKFVATEKSRNPNHDLIALLEDKLVVLEIKEKEYLGKFTAQNRLVKNLQNEIRMIKTKIKQQEQKRYQSRNFGKNPIYHRIKDEIYGLEADLKAADAKTIGQQTLLDKYQTRLETYNRIEFRLEQLEQELAMDRENYKLYQAKLEESRISDAMDDKRIAAVSMIEAASRPLKPVNRNLKLNLLVAIALGVFGGIGWVLCIEAFRNRIESVEDVERFLRLPVLASISEMQPGASHHRHVALDKIEK